MKSLLRIVVFLACVAGFVGLSNAQPVPGTPGSGWSWDPARQGMVNLRVVKPIEGCLAPGGLQRITDIDEPGSAQFWCGTPPFCLTDAGLTASEQCRFVSYCRRDPRGDPNGRPGANPCRDPEDLICVNTGLPPIAGRCPLPPELTAAITPATVTVGQNTELTINSPHATSLSMLCTGANSAFPPYNETNLNAYAGSSQTFAPSQSMLVGTTTCSITASNARGSISGTASFVANAIPRPTVTASFSPNNPVAGADVRLTTNTSNATSLSWTCTGRWNNRNTPRNVGRVSTDHTATGSAGTATCTFTATGPGGTATATASWTSTAANTGGNTGGNSGVTPETPANGCPAQNLLFGAHGMYCPAALPRGVNGQQLQYTYQFAFVDGKALFICSGGTWGLVRIVEPCMSSGLGG